MNKSNETLEMNVAIRRSVLFPQFGRRFLSNTSVKDQVANEIASNKAVLVYSKTTCPFCSAAKEVLEYGVDLEKYPMKVHELDRVANGFEVQKALLELTGQRTVPNIFIGSTHIGGYTDLERAFQEKKIQSLLDEL